MSAGRVVTIDVLAGLLLTVAAQAEFVAGPTGHLEDGATIEESYAIDGDDILIRQSPRDGADRLLPPTVALAVQYGLKLRVEDAAGGLLDLTDLRKPTPHGPTVRVAGTGDYVIRAPLARYIFAVPASPPADAEDEPLVEELAQRVARFVASGHQGPVPREYGYVSDMVFWFEGETVSALAQAMPYVPESERAAAKAYLAHEVKTYLLDEKNLDFERRGKIGIVEWDNHTAATGQAVAALDDYARATGDWALTRQQWDACKRVFQQYNVLHWHYGCNPQGRLHVAYLLGVSDLPAQFASAAAVARLARHLGDAPTETIAAGIAARLLITRYAYGVYVRPYLYDNKFTEAPSRTAGDGTRIDYLPARERYPKHAWPYDAPPTTIWPREMRFLPDGSNDPRVVVAVGAEGRLYRVGMTPAGSDLKNLVLHYPLPPGMARFLGDVLGRREREYFDAFEANIPWWHWSDFETIIERGDETIASPDISFSMYQLLAWTLGADAEQLRRRLPWEYLNVGFRDRFRLINLGTYLRAKHGARWEVAR